MPGPPEGAAAILEARPPSYPEPSAAVLLFVSITGLIFLLLVAALSVAYLALPGERFCPRCGEATHPVRFRRWLRPVGRLLHWRWCADCGWEGLGRPPRASSAGERFRWRRLDPRR